MANDSDFWIDLKKGESPIRLWDKLTLGGITWPGLCLVETGVGLDIDVAKFPTKLASGTSPAQFQITLTDNGYAPGDVNAIVQIWTQEQWEDLQETLPKFSPRSGNQQGSSIGNSNPRLSVLPVSNPNAKSIAAKGRDAFDIVHPATALLGIDSVIVKRIRLLPISEQTLFVQLEMLQYFPQTGRKLTHSSGGPVVGFDVPDVKAADNLGG